MLTTLCPRLCLALVLAATLAALASPARGQAVHEDRCTFENPNLWGLRFRQGESMTVAGCEAQCVRGGGNGYLCLSVESGFCLCGTAAKPTSTGPESDMCTDTCAGGDDSCGGPSSSYTCYAQGAPAELTTAAPALSWPAMLLASALLMFIAFVRRRAV